MTTTAIIITTTVVALFAWLYARQQAQLYWPFRELGFDQFAKDKREGLSDRAHAYGLAVCLVICIGIALTQSLNLPVGALWWQIVFRPLLHLISLLCTFSLVFDIAFAVSFGQPWYYLGSTAKSDAIERQLFGKKEGIAKATICALLVIACVAALKVFL